MFITIEGIDGSGKTTTGKMLKEYLENLGKKIYLTEEPTKIFVDVKNLMEKDLDAFTRTFIFMADRVEHIKIMKKKIEEGYIVICDRYVDSTFAYQGAILKHHFGSMESTYEYLNNIYKPFAFEPDIIIYLDVEPELGMRRIDSRKREFFERIDYLKEVRSFYLFLSKTRKYIVIDSNGDLKKVWEDLKKNLKF